MTFNDGRKMNPHLRTADSPLISVVMPVFNGERFVSEAIESVLRQSYEHIEFIIVDDGSTDSTPHILASFANTDPRVQVVQQPRNVGFREALNEGCRRSKGEFIARMDADDVSLPERLSRQLATMRADPELGAIGSFVQVIDEHGQRGPVKTFPINPGMVAWSMAFFNSLAHPAVMMRRDIVEAVGWYPDGCSGGTEDYALFIQLSRITRLGNVPEVLLLYRIWSGSMSLTSAEKQAADGARILRQSVFDACGLDISVNDVRALYGLATDLYPRTRADIRHLADIIVRLQTSYSRHFHGLTQVDLNHIDDDAAVRLWTLAAVAASRRSPQLAAHLSAAATSIRPLSIFRFLSKIVRRAMTWRSRGERRPSSR